MRLNHKQTQIIRDVADIITTFHHHQSKLLGSFKCVLPKSAKYKVQYLFDLCTFDLSKIFTLLIILVHKMFDLSKISRGLLKVEKCKNCSWCPVLIRSLAEISGPLARKFQNRKLSLHRSQDEFPVSYVMTW